MSHFNFFRLPIGIFSTLMAIQAPALLSSHISNDEAPHTATHLITAFSEFDPQRMFDWSYQQQKQQFLQIDQKGPGQPDYVRLKKIAEELKNQPHAREITQNMWDFCLLTPVDKTNVFLLSYLVNNGLSPQLREYAQQELNNSFSQNHIDEQKFTFILALEEENEAVQKYIDSLFENISRYPQALSCLGHHIFSGVYERPIIMKRLLESLDNIDISNLHPYLQVSATMLMNPAYQVRGRELFAQLSHMDQSHQATHRLVHQLIQKEAAPEIWRPYFDDMAKDPLISMSDKWNAISMISYRKNKEALPYIVHLFEQANGPLERAYLTFSILSTAQNESLIEEVLNRFEVNINDIIKVGQQDFWQLDNVLKRLKERGYINDALRVCEQLLKLGSMDILPFVTESLNIDELNHLIKFNISEIQPIFLSQLLRRIQNQSPGFVEKWIQDPDIPKNIRNNIRNDFPNLFNQGVSQNNYFYNPGNAFQSVYNPLEDFKARLTQIENRPHFLNFEERMASYAGLPFINDPVLIARLMEQVKRDFDNSDNWEKMHILNQFTNYQSHETYQYLRQEAISIGINLFKVRQFPWQIGSFLPLLQTSSNEKENIYTSIIRLIHNMETELHQNLLVEGDKTSVHGRKSHRQTRTVLASLLEKYKPDGQFAANINILKEAQQEAQQLMKKEIEKNPIIAELWKDISINLEVLKQKWYHNNDSEMNTHVNIRLNGHIITLGEIFTLVYRDAKAGSDSLQALINVLSEGEIINGCDMGIAYHLTNILAKEYVHDNVRSYKEDLISSIRNDEYAIADFLLKGIQDPSQFNLEAIHSFIKNTDMNAKPNHSIAPILNHFQTVDWRQIVGPNQSLTREALYENEDLFTWGYQPLVLAFLVDHYPDILSFENKKAPDDRLYIYPHLKDIKELF